MAVSIRSEKTGKSKALSFKKIGDSFGATKIFHAFDIPDKLAPDQENSEYFMRLGNTALLQCGGCPSGGGEPPRTSLN